MNEVPVGHSLIFGSRAVWDIQVCPVALRMPRLIVRSWPICGSALRELLLHLSDQCLRYTFLGGADGGAIHLPPVSTNKNRQKGLGAATYRLLVVGFQPQQATRLAFFELEYRASNNVFSIRIHAIQDLPTESLNHPSRVRFIDDFVLAAKTKGFLGFEWRSADLTPALEEVLC